jgi:hypothetical protein
MRGEDSALVVDGDTERPDRAGDAGQRGARIDAMNIPPWPVS